MVTCWFTRSFGKGFTPKISPNPQQKDTERKVITTSGHEILGM